MPFIDQYGKLPGFDFGATPSPFVVFSANPERPVGETYDDSDGEPEYDASEVEDGDDSE